MKTVINPFLRVFLGAALFFFVLSLGMAASGQDLENIDFGIEVMDWNGGEVVVDEALVQFEFVVSASEQAAIHQKLNCAVIENVAEGLVRIDLNGKPLQKALDEYNSEAIVKYAEPHVVYRTFHTPNDTNWNLQWGPQNMKCPQAWDLYKGGANSVVAVLDSSLDGTHSEISGNLVFEHDYYNGDNSAYDLLDFIGHGTHCSGIAAAVTNNSNGIAGVGYNCKLAFYQVGMVILISDSAVIQSINDTVSRGWQVISMSFGGSGQSQSMQTALNNAYNAGVVCVAAAGNDGNTQMLYPAGYSCVLSVASHNQANQKSSFSTYGPWVDVSAPGENIYSTIYIFWGSYAYMDGTSMACPHVAGMANILYSLIGGQRNKANADLIRATIEDTSVSVSWVKHGRVDVEAAMQQLLANDPPVISDVSPSTVQAFQGGTITLTGENFTDATEVNSGGTVLTLPDFNIVNDTTITYAAPTANALGSTAVTVTNPAGTSDPGYFTYVETDPPKLEAAASTAGGEWFNWSYGGGADDYYWLFVSPNSTTFTYKGFDILAYYTIIYTDYLDSAGTGELDVLIPSGLAGLTFHSQVATFDPNFVGASNIQSTLITN